MTPISRKPLLQISSSSPIFSIQISHLLPFCSVKHAHTHCSSSSYSSSLRRDEENRSVRVSVWWDFENCNLPVNMKPFKVASSITAAVRANGIKGPIQITAFGDMFQMSRSNQEALSATGINLTHVPRGGKNSADRSLLADLLYWVSQNPPPAHLFLISGDRDFASILHRLRMNNYNILLASQQGAPGILCSAASIMWHWHALLVGENLTGKYFNQPPDGPYGSWYGHYKVPLEDPFSLEQLAHAQGSMLPEPDSDSKLILSASESKPCPIPKTVIKKIRHILKSNPKGISINGLRAELKNCNLCFDTGFYGHKKFTDFLASMPQILRLERAGYGNYWIHDATAKSAESIECNPGISSYPDSDNKDQLVCENNSVSDTPSSKLSLPASPEPNVESSPENMKRLTEQPSYIDQKSIPPPSPENLKHLEKAQRHSSIDEKSVSPPDKVKPLEKAQQLSSIDEKSVSTPDKIKPLLVSMDGNVEVDKAQETESDLPPPVGQTDVGYFKRIWRKWFGSRVNVSGTIHSNQEQFHISGDGTEKEGHDTFQKHCTDVDNSGKEKRKEMSVTSTSQLVDPVPPTSSSSSHNESSLDNKSVTCPIVDVDKSCPGLFNQIVNRFMFWKSESSPSSDNFNDPCDRAKLMKSYSQENKLFSKDSFWADIESFLDTPKGSIILSESRTREQLVLNLQKEGPLFLRSLANSDLLEWVDLLISEKKWVEECPSQASSPFKLAQESAETSQNHSHLPNKLSSIFSRKPCQHDMQRSPEHDGEGERKNISHTGVSLPVIKKPLSDKSKRVIMADCQKLVNDKLEEYPEGYNIGLFRKAFRDRYGYNLDLNMLGYEKLGSLLQTMNGVTVKSFHIFPSNEAPERFKMETDPGVQRHTVNQTVINSNSQCFDSRKDDDSDSLWEELGPVTNTRCHKNVEDEALKRKEIGSTGFGYEAPFSDFSDSDEETVHITAPGRRVSAGVNDGESSLLGILDSWYSIKNGETSKDASANVDAMVGSTNVSRASLGKFEHKSRHWKNYSFVGDTTGDKNDEVMEGILSSLKKKSSEPSFQS